MKLKFNYTLSVSITAIAMLLASCGINSKKNQEDTDKIVSIYQEGIEQINNADNDIDKIYEICDSVEIKVSIIVDNNEDFSEFYEAQRKFDNTTCYIFQYHHLAIEKRIIENNTDTIYSVPLPNPVPVIKCRKSNALHDGVLIYKEGLDRIKNATDMHEVYKIIDEVDMKIRHFVNNNKILSGNYKASWDFYNAMREKAEKI